MTTRAQSDAVERLVHEAVGKVDAIAPEALRALAPAMMQARNELEANLRKWLADNADSMGDRFTVFQRKRALASLDGALDRIGELQPAMAGALRMGREETGGIAAANTIHEITRLSSIFDGGAVIVPQLDTAAVIADGKRLLWKRHERSAERYAGGLGDDLRNRMAVSLASGETFHQAANRLCGSQAFRQMLSGDPAHMAEGIADANMHRWRHWADRLVRTENMHAYNVQHDISIEHINDVSDEEYLRRWDATGDVIACERCKDLDRRLATVDGEFKGGYKSPPLHPYCRCVVVAWLARWGDFKGEAPSKGDDGHDIARQEDPHDPRNKPPLEEQVDDLNKRTAAKAKALEPEPAPPVPPSHAHDPMHTPIADLPPLKVSDEALDSRIDRAERQARAVKHPDAEKVAGKLRELYNTSTGQSYERPTPSGGTERLTEEQAARLAQHQLEQLRKDAARLAAQARRAAKAAPVEKVEPKAAKPAPEHSAPPVAVPGHELPPVWEKKKNPKRVEAGRKAGEAAAERLREIHSAVSGNLSPDLQIAWQKEGHKFIKENGHRIKGMEDRINAASKLSEAFAETYGSGEQTIHGNEGDRHHKRAEIEAEHAEKWADEQEAKYYEAARKAHHADEDEHHGSGESHAAHEGGDDDVPF